MEKIREPFSIIIPAYNEGQIIGEVLRGLKDYLRSQNFVYEIIVVDDGSTDNTKDIVEKIEGIRLIHHSSNRGYGASLKNGAQNARFDWLLFFDADGQHRPEYISELVKNSEDNAMVVGERKGYKGPLLRQPGKKIFQICAEDNGVDAGKLRV